MSEIVNLRQARKRNAKALEAQLAAENRARFGRTPGELTAHKRQAEQEKARLDGAQLQPGLANLAKDVARTS